LPAKGDLSNARKHEGEPKLPFKVFCMLFLFFWDGLFLFLATGPFYCFVNRPLSGVKSKRIFLSADAAFIKRSNQFGSYLR
jgi:hypothetical protein